MERLLNMLAIFSIGLIIVVMRSLRRQHIRVEYSVSWLGAAFVLLILALWPGLLDRVADFLGVQDRSLALLTAVMSVFLVVFYRVSIIISALKDANIALTQKVAILEYRIESLHENLQAPAVR